MSKMIQTARTETAFFLPAKHVMATWQSVSSEETRYYLNGLYCEHDGAGVNMIATDGHTLIHTVCPDGAFIGESVMTQRDLHCAGFILSTDIKDKAWKAKTVGDLWVYGDTETGILQFVDYIDGDLEHRRVGVLEFSRIDGTFPDWRRIMPAETENSHPVCVNAEYITRMARAERIMSGEKSPFIRIEQFEPGAPMRVTFRDHDAACMTGVIMPVRWSQ